MSDLIKDIRNNRIQAFRHLFNDYSPMLCALAHQYIADRECCKDIAQDALLTYWELRERFDDIRQVKSFLYITTRNKSLNVLKHEQFKDESASMPDIIADEVLEDRIIRQETYLQVRRSVESLPGQMQRIIRLSMSGKRNSEIARILSISEGTVHSLKKTAYKKLRIILKEHFFLLLFI